MSVVATLLFGSVARSDHEERSDTDLLLINLDDETRHVSVGHASIFLYPWLRLKLDAKEGDLFACHLAYEAKAISDPQGYLSKLKKSFRFKSNYQSEIARASELGWFLARFGEGLNSALQAKRILWCVRTILIARSAELRDPVFAPKLLAGRAKSDAARDLLSNRHDRRDEASLRYSLRVFLTEETKVESFHERAGREAFARRFKETSNQVALQTLRQEENSQAGYGGA
jgi:predicted nucleotidyltransferase